MKTVKVADVGVMKYAEALELQRSYFDEVTKSDQGGVLMLVEHPHVYTLGKSGDAHNLLINDEFLKRIDAEYHKTDRGGDITYHGYGQLVGYPILNLDNLGISLRKYIELVEQAIIDTIADFGIVSGRVEGATGVWIEGDTPHKARKIAAIGVRASRGVTMHGFALNVTTDLSYFNHINPCGMADRGVSSTMKEAQMGDMEHVKATFCSHFERLFNVLTAQN